MIQKLNADYHTHTFRSDGHSTCEENIIEARKRGLKTLAITDHGPFHARSRRCTLDNQLVNKYELKNLQEKYKDIKLLFGIEANLVSLRGDLDIRESEQKAFDIIVVGQHRGPHGLTFLDNINFRLRNLFPSTKKRREKMTNAYLLAMQRYDSIKILAHLNRYVKVNIKPIAEMAAKKGILIELNGKKVNFTDKDIKDILDAGANFVISSDAHRSKYVGNPTKVWEFLKTHHIPEDRIVNLQKEN